MLPVDGALRRCVPFWSITLPPSRPSLIVLVVIGFLGIMERLFIAPKQVLQNPDLQPADGSTHIRC